MADLIYTPLYAALFALLLFALSVRTLLLRRRFKVGVGPGQEPLLERAMRVHANFCEYVPVTLLLVFFLELLTGPGWWIHSLCAALLLGRLLHAWGVSQVKEDYRYRIVGMAVTFAVILVSAAGILVSYSPWI
ncbi:MAG: MAPEG family protein [Pseudomonadota bacterium]